MENGNVKSNFYLTNASMHFVEALRTFQLKSSSSEYSSEPSSSLSSASKFGERSPNEFYY